MRTHSSLFPPQPPTHTHTLFSIPHHHSKHLSILSPLTLCPWGFGDKGQQRDCWPQGQRETETKRTEREGENVSVCCFFALACLWSCAITLQWVHTEMWKICSLCRFIPKNAWKPIKTTEKITCRLNCWAMDYYCCLCILPIQYYCHATNKHGSSVCELLRLNVWMLQRGNRRGRSKPKKGKMSHIVINLSFNADKGTERWEVYNIGDCSSVMWHLGLQTFQEQETCRDKVV